MEKELTKTRWEVRLHQVLSTDELAQVAFLNFVAKEKAMKDGKRTPVIDWMVFNTSCWGLRISESVYLTCGALYLGDTPHIDLRVTKGGKPRDVFIGSVFAQILQEYLEWKRARNEPTGKDSPFFLSRASRTFMTPEGLRKAFKRAIRRGGITKGVTPHAGRHTLATHMSPEFLGVVQKILGHSSLATTQIYAHVLSPHIHEFVEKYEELMYSGIKQKPKKE
jgi:site-specific recombinase XerD